MTLTVHTLGLNSWCDRGGLVHSASCFYVLNASRTGSLGGRASSDWDFSTVATSSQITGLPSFSYPTLTLIEK
ncbi:hypothetical protein E2C01_093287 [Portunus trituberculatus]|uniref:Uncharacterized protein n=1 Tax=Portunus trituberculatus TaxID=210409 RepID=A0A5B7JIL3_PORTR|nr:hypothetical protein [Portunus trituberculatus]